MKAWLSWWFYVLLIGTLVVSFLAAGLTMGLTTLTPENVQDLLNIDERYARSEEDRAHIREQKKYARRILPVIEKPHRLLVTLLLTGSMANEALPMMLNRLMPDWLAVVTATALVMVWSELVPGAVFRGERQLETAARLSRVVQLLQCLLAVLVYPIAAALDCILGEDHRSRYQPGELVAMLSGDQVAGCFEADTRKMLLGAVDTERSRVGDEGILTPMNRVFMLPLDGKMDGDTMARIFYSGFSRVLVYGQNKHNIRGVLIVKRLLFLDPHKERRIDTLHLKEMHVFPADMTLHDALNVFQQGRSHMAVVTSCREKVEDAWRYNRPIPPDVHMAGIVTLESILENILREEIEDEDDRRKAQLLSGSIRSMRNRMSTGDMSDHTSRQYLLQAVFERWRKEWRLNVGGGSSWNASYAGKSKSVPNLGGAVSDGDAEPMEEGKESNVAIWKAKRSSLKPGKARTGHRGSEGSPVASVLAEEGLSVPLLQKLRLKRGTSLESLV